MKLAHIVFPLIVILSFENTEASTEASATPFLAQNFRQDRPHERGHRYQGDILLGPPKTSPGSKKGAPHPLSGVRDGRKRWPFAQVIYAIDASFSPAAYALIMGAMKEISEKTCIQFQRRTNEKDFVQITARASDCSSHIGRLGIGPQPLHLGPNCLYHGTIIHELVHSLGFEHEQARPDRDRYIEIVWNNIPRELHYAFARKGWNEVSDFGVTYDLHSIMHYSPYAFAIDGTRPTIKSLDPALQFGPGNHLSVKDIQKLRNMYGIPSTWNCQPRPAGFRFS